MVVMETLWCVCGTSAGPIILQQAGVLKNVYGVGVAALLASASCKSDCQSLNIS